MPEIHASGVQLQPPFLLHLAQDKGDLTSVDFEVLAVLACSSDSQLDSSSPLRPKNREAGNLVRILVAQQVNRLDVINHAGKSRRRIKKDIVDGIVVDG